jgi:hypothetical protein
MKGPIGRTRSGSPLTTGCQLRGVARCERCGPSLTGTDTGAFNGGGLIGCSSVSPAGLVRSLMGCFRRARLVVAAVSRVGMVGAANAQALTPGAQRKEQGREGGDQSALPGRLHKYLKARRRSVETSRV